MNFTEEEIVRIGERINNTAKIFNILAGFTKEDDKLPRRIMEEPIPAGSSKGQYIPQEDLNMMLEEYYEARGWSGDGIPVWRTFCPASQRP